MEVAVVIPRAGSLVPAVATFIDGSEVAAVLAGDLFDLHLFDLMCVHRFSIGKLYFEVKRNYTQAHEIF